MYFKRNKQNKNQQNVQNHTTEEKISSSLTANLDWIKKKTGESSDLVIRPIKAGVNFDMNATVVFIEGIVEGASINDFLIKSILSYRNWKEVIASEQIFDIISEQVISLGSTKKICEWNDLFLSLMAGESIILVDGVVGALSASTTGGEKRSVSEPTAENVVRGPQQAFTESLRTNTGLVRRIIKNPDLWLESLKIGKMTNTDVAIMFIKGTANEKVVEEVRSRLQRIDIDSILESGYIEQLVEDQTLTTFPTLYHTQRPDAVAGNLLEGRIAIFVDGTPYVLLAPAVFIQFFQSTEDYYTRFDIATSIRLLRVIIFIISILGPAIYIAATTFHQEMIPTQLLVIIAAQRESVPFPTLIEAFIMEVVFEILREAGIRLPKVVGSTVSIVGALVIGQAAVQAGIVSPVMVIVVAITAMANFATPAFSIAISARLIRFLFMFVAAVFGFYGIVLGIIMLIVHLCSLRSFGTPYMTPLAPFIPANIGDSIVRQPLWAINKRPKLISKENETREGHGLKPQPDDERGMKNSTLKKGDQNEV
ncbi:spore germination protein [Bacillus cihuensis]|uniref:spore germination protein n=1 Tax=Bacillus cihuensis TaxID=1208599 RepID=UPI0004026C56|nr:spore germination protein [Bacillus cihuensis]